MPASDLDSCRLEYSYFRVSPEGWVRPGTDLQHKQKTAAQRTGLVDHDLINPLGLYVVYAPIWNLPATPLYCCPVTVLEWNSGDVFILPPVAEPEPLISHHSRSSALMRS